MLVLSIPSFEQEVFIVQNFFAINILKQPFKKKGIMVGSVAKGSLV